ncbi:MAG: recombinase family protein [Oscillospiraceae bacterium]|jgi:DNA invertase Pin-like site-specific DNA recombinase|nr:recombinase family protein [Oscillospiraceae bacterium]
MPNVQVIPAKKPKLSAQVAAPTTLRRVAGYARVSTDKDEQLNSYEAQLDYYTNYIKSRPDWEFVKVYTDEGISALNTKRREGFNQMVADALAGKIDLIVTKSVSRFARNTVDSLSTIRKLKEHGTEVYFEKEAIWTFDGKGELLITIMSSLAQEESRSLSENVTWGKRKSMADGNISLPWKNFLGYRKGADGLPEIVPEEAEIVRLIYRLFMQGKTYSAIAKHLTAEGIPSPTGKDNWTLATVRNILTNETHRGSKKMQKTFVTNYLTKAKKANEGELPSYYIAESHEPIIPPDEWDAVQAEIARRKQLGRPVSCQSPFSTKIICGGCGAFFGSKVWQSNTKYRQIIWRCNDRYNKRGKRDCNTSHVKEDDIKAGFVTAFNQLSGCRKSVIEDCRTLQKMLCDTSEIDGEIAALEREVEEVEGLARQAINTNAREVIDQTEWTERNGVYLKRHAEATKRLEELDQQKLDRVARSKTIEVFIKEFERRKEIIAEWDEELWLATVESVTVGLDGSLTYKFKNGTEIKT